MTKDISYFGAIPEGLHTCNFLFRKQILIFFYVLRLFLKSVFTPPVFDEQCSFQMKILHTE